MTFIVGQEDAQQTFVVHKDFATHYSSSLAKAFNSLFLEGQTHEMRLEDVSGEDFGKLVHWLYTKQIEEATPEEEIETCAELLSLAKLWTLGERFLIVEFQNQVMRRIVHLVKAEKKVSDLRELFSYAYEARAETPLKRLVVDKLAWDVEPDVLKAIKSDGVVPADMWPDITMVLSKHYWHLMPAEYVNKWGNMQDYLVNLSAVGLDAEARDGL